MAKIPGVSDNLEITDINEKQSGSVNKVIADLTSVNISKNSQPFLNRKIRGKIVDKAGKIKVRNNQIIIYATPVVNSGEQKSQVIGVCRTDSDGNFSFPFPLGEFKHALAVASIKPTEFQEIVLNEKHEFPDFIWIVLESIPGEMTQEEHDDCACKGDKTPFLPDMEELLQNSTYSQDIGGSCMNFTTPNRALEEFNYLMVVRTSDPELFGISVDKIKDRLKYINDKIVSIQKQLSPFTAELSSKIDFDKLPKKVSEAAGKQEIQRIEEVLNEFKNTQR